MTREELKKQFETNGISFAEWARQNGFKPNDVHRVVSGFSKAKRGLGHKIAVKLGLKQPDSGTQNTNQDNFK